MLKTPIIIDTDPGLDDFIALMLAASSNKLDIKGLCAVSGNVGLDVTSRNLLNIATMLNVDAPVAKGASKPLVGEPHDAAHVHGEDGLGGIELPASTREFSKDYAWDLIYKTAKEYKGELVLIALGPLTNIATCILKYPDLKDYLKKIVLMGGSTTIGNVTPYAEFNIWADPVAADVVFKSGIDVTMVGLNVTMNTKLTQQEASNIAERSSLYGKELLKAFNNMLSFYRSTGLTDMVIHDALTVASVIDESILTCEKYYTTVETLSDLTFGKTVVDLINSHRDKEKNINVAINSDPSKFKQLLLEMATSY